jgi:hypothetical protein
MISTQSRSGLTVGLRRIHAILPLLLIAWLAQIVAPIGASAAAVAALDPLAGAVICTHVAATPNDAGPVHPASGDDCCAFCTATAPVGTPPVPLAAPVPPATLVLDPHGWRTANVTRPNLALEQRFRARAPPSFS